MKHRNQRRMDKEADPLHQSPTRPRQRSYGTRAVSQTARIIAAALAARHCRDTRTTRAELARAFGKPIAAVVAEVTTTSGAGQENQEEASVEQAPAASPSAKLVKLADKICNLRDLAASPPADWSLARRREYFDWAKLVVDALRGRERPSRARLRRAYRARP